MITVPLQQFQEYEDNSIYWSGHISYVIPLTTGDFGFQQKTPSNHSWKMHFFECAKPLDTPNKNGWPWGINRRHFGGLEKFVQFRITAPRFENIWNDPKCWFFKMEPQDESSGERTEKDIGWRNNPEICIKKDI